MPTGGGPVISAIPVVRNVIAGSNGILIPARSDISVRRLLTPIALWIGLCCGSVAASEEMPMDDPAQSLWQRVQQLEAESAAMQAEIQALREAVPSGIEAIPVTTDASIVAQDGGAV